MHRGHPGYANLFRCAPATPYRVDLRAGSFIEAGFSLARERDLIKEYGQVLLGYGRSPLVWMQGLKTYLEHYPYECTEQLLSRAMPALVTAMSGPVPASRFCTDQWCLHPAQATAEFLGRFWSVGKQSGGFSPIYPSMRLIFSSRPRNVVLPCPTICKTHAFGYLAQLAGGRAEGLSELRTRTRAIYLLTPPGTGDHRSPGGHNRAAGKILPKDLENRSLCGLCGGESDPDEAGQLR